MVNKEVGHYVVTAHPPGGVLLTARCNFLSPFSLDVLVAKSRRLEVRRLRSSSNSDEDRMSGTDPAAGDGGGVPSPFPVVLQVPINGRIVSLLPLKIPNSATSYAFLMTDQFNYAVISHNPSVPGPYPIKTHASGSFKGENNHIFGREAESGPVCCGDHYHRCIALHLYDGLITILPVNTNYQPPRQLKSSGENSDDRTSSRQHQYLHHSQPQVLGKPFHCRIEERVILSMTFLQTTAGGGMESGSESSSNTYMPQLCILHQDARGAQHVTTHLVDLSKHQLLLHGSTQAPNNTQWLRKSNIDGGSSLVISVPPPNFTAVAAASTAVPNTDPNSAPDTTCTNNSKKQTVGGVIVVGQRQLTYCSTTSIKVVPVPQSLFLTFEELPADPAGMSRFLLGDEFGNLHMLTAVQVQDRIVGLQLDTLGSCTLSTALAYLGEGLVYVGSALGDSQLMQVHDEPINNMELQQNQQTTEEDVDLMDTTYLSVVEEYTNLGPILDFDLIPTAPGSALQQGGHNQGNNAMVQSQVVTASGSSKSGSIRLIRNGIGMNEFACQEMPGIQNMWSLRKSCYDQADTYLVQSFVGETRVLGVTTIVDKDDEDEKMAQSDDQDDDEVEGTLEEVFLPGLESAASTLYIGNVEPGNCLVQVTETEVRLVSLNNVAASIGILDTWSNIGGSPITVATANEAGQVALALAGGMVIYFCIVHNDESKTTRLVKQHEKQMDRQVSCLDLHPFSRSKTATNNKAGPNNAVAMDMDVDSVGGSNSTKPGATTLSLNQSSMVAVGLWDDFTVRLLSLLPSNDSGALLDELLCINLSTDEDGEEDATNNLERGEESMNTTSTTRRNRNNMMARSLSLTTLDLSSSSSTTNLTGSSSSNCHSGVNMLFVGLGDGTLISFVVIQERQELRTIVSVQSRKEVCLGTRSIGLVPLSTEQGGTCVLATGDRPTVIYLAGLGGTSQANYFNPKLCYSNVNLSSATMEDHDDEEVVGTAVDDVSRPPQQQSIAVTVASPFFSPVLFDATSFGNQHYSLAIADDANLRLGVIDDIQKLHVTTCRLGMAPRRIVHCPELRLFAVGCIESGIKHFGITGDEANLGNCIRFMDDTNFDDIERVDLEPFEMILSMVHASMRVPEGFESTSSTAGDTARLSSAEGNAANAADAVYKSFLLVGTAYALPDEDEPTRGRILVYSCQATEASGAAAGTAGSTRAIRQVTEFSTSGGVYSMCQFYDGRILCTVNSKTLIGELQHDQNRPNAGVLKLAFCGAGHHGHILSLFVKSRASVNHQTTAASPGQHSQIAAETSGSAVATGASSGVVAMDVAETSTRRTSDQNNQKEVGSDNKKKSSKDCRERLAIVGDLMRSISLVQFYPQHETLEEVARDFNAKWTTAVEMLTDDIYLGAENWNNLYTLRRNTAASVSEEVRCRLDTAGEFHLGEMVNKFMSGSLVMPVATANNTSSGVNASSNSIANSRRTVRRSSSPQKKKALSSPSSPDSKGKGASARFSRPIVGTGSQTLFGTVDGSLGVILGLDGPSAAFFSCMERAMATVIRPIGNFSHQLYRACQSDRQRIHPAHGFVDGDLVESFLDLDKSTMEAVVEEMNRDGNWEVTSGRDAGVPKNDTENNDDTVVTNKEGGDNENNNSLCDENQPELSTDDVLAMVEEMTMLH